MRLMFNGARVTRADGARVRIDPTVTIPNDPPTAAFAVTAVTDLTVELDGTGSTDLDGSIAGYAWGFGDGTVATGATASHTYAAAGTYTVTLTVTDDVGATDTTARTVTVTAPVNQAPTAVFTSEVDELTVTADGAGSTDPDGAITGYAWSYGDDSSVTGAAAVSHTYATAGTYTVVLTVTDDDGATGTASQTVTVTAPAATAPAVPTNVQVIESPEKATYTDWDDPQTDVVWDVDESRNPGVPITPPEGLTQRFRQTGQWLFPGEEYSYRVRSRRPATGATSEWSVPGSVTLAGGTAPEPEPEPVDTTALNETQLFVQDARATFYPGTNPALDHMRPLVRPDAFGILRTIPTAEGGWPVIYCVPDNAAGDAFTAPNGEYVHRGRRFDPQDDSALRAAVGPERLAIIRFPVKFENVPGGFEITNMHGRLLQGLNPKVTKWLAGTTGTFYRTEADAEARTNPAYTGAPRPGVWHYPSTAPDIDPDDVHKQTVYVQGWESTTLADQFPGMGFHFEEGTYIEGDYAFEGWNWNGAHTFKRLNFLVGHAGFRQDRAGVLMKPNSSNKRPGGDPRQVFGGCLMYVERGATAAAVGYQGGFYQNHQAASSYDDPDRPRLLDIRWTNTRWESDTTTYGGRLSSGGPTQFAAPGTGWGSSGYLDYVHHVNDVYVWRPRDSAGNPQSRSTLIGGDWPGVTVADVADFVPATQVGTNYVPVDDLPAGAETFVLRTTKPAATNTGLSVSGTSETPLASSIPEGSVTASSTPITITTGGTQAKPRVIRGVHFRRPIRIANGVSWVTFEDGVHELFGTPTVDERAIEQFGADTTGIVVKNSVLRLQADARHYLRAYAVQGRAITLERCDISGWGDGFGPSSIAGVRGYGKAHGCYFHDIPHHDYDGWPNRPGSHEDGSHPDTIQAQYGLELLEVIGCTMPAPYTAALLAKSSAANPITKLVAENNWVYLDDPKGVGFNFLDMEAGGAEDWSVKRNEFDMRLDPNRAAIAASPAFISSTVWEGNVHHDGTPVRVWNGSQLVTV